MKAKGFGLYELVLDFTARGFLPPPRIGPKRLPAKKATSQGAPARTPDRGRTKARRAE